MNEVINFNYEKKIPFRIDENGEVFMNATKMMEPFPEKRMHNFTRNKTTIEFVNALHEANSKTPISALVDSELVSIKKGGNDSGTWFQRNLALEFARWLNPKFNVWCNQRIDEIITKITTKGMRFLFVSMRTEKFS